ncbi:hypothetical protein SARC_07371 [Sphaeroforma arctica JP610]|uniref:Uncharacterized protein n=1 Tax=Sphaeroforma arctica JP610 TaxID=667725 RepID=A0A0L0FUN2_9EUKA|nr:hypothetical protein SARC_07371 [Sphaeroforma arctica JP610]KNC80261.1 hypothetical protein SARC_07371 [Sphaeroforma arctica JP610]|eukprot:XP_014154163.1 hypothetical protein SARC_07371 [Sphaeroforma arctica JP610]
MPQVYSRGRISVFGMDNDKDKGSIGSINLSIRKIPIWKWFIGALLVCVVVYTNTYAAEDNTVAVQNIPVRADNVSIHDSNPAHPDNIEKGYTSGEVNVLDNMETHNAMLMRSNPLKKDTEPLKDIATSSFSMDIPALPRKRTVGGMITPAADPCNSAATQENLLTDKYTLIMLVHGWTKWEQFIRDITPRDAPRLEQVMQKRLCVYGYEVFKTVYYM